MTAMSLVAGLCAAHAESPLEFALLAAVRAVHFADVIDFGAGNEARPVKAHLGSPAKKNRPAAERKCRRDPV